MKELITMWKSTRMIVLTALSAAVYAAVLIPLKPIPIIPGFTEFRPANVLPVICSLMFGPAAAWGSAIGNTIADAFGTWGLGTIFGFVGNFLYGYIPYKMWQSFGKGEPVAESRLSTAKSLIIALIAGIVVSAIVMVISYYEPPIESPIYAIAILVIAFGSVFLVLRFLSVRYFLLILSASAACGVFIGWGVHILGLVPFVALGNIIVLNDFLVSAVLGPLLLPLLYPVVKRMGLIYTDVMEESDISKSRVWGSALMVIAVIGGLIAGNLVTIGEVGRVSLGLGLSPFIILILLAATVM